jgi:hypothetical protein
MFTILFPLTRNVVEIHLGGRGDFPNLSVEYEYSTETLQIFRELPDSRPYFLTRAVGSRARSGMGASARNYKAEEYTLDETGVYVLDFRSNVHPREHRFEWGLDNGHPYVSFLRAPVGTRIITDDEVFTWEMGPIRLNFGREQVQVAPIEPEVLPKSAWERLGEDDTIG